MALKVLIVDDSSTVRLVIAKALGIGKIPVAEIHQAANGQEALGILAAEWVDLVFSDLTMPVMGGMEMVAKMAQDDILKTIPVIVVSTEGSAARIEQLKAQGIAAYVRKPFSPESLCKAVRDTLEV